MREKKMRATREFLFAQPIFMCSENIASTILHGRQQPQLPLKHPAEINTTNLILRAGGYKTTGREKKQQRPISFIKIGQLVGAESFE